MNIDWVKRGVALIAFALGVALPISFFLPIFSGPLILIFSDAVLLGLSAVVAGLVPLTSRAWRLVAWTLVWMALSLAMEVPYLTETISDVRSGADRGTHAMGGSLAEGPPAVVSVVGVANPILAARGYRREVMPDIHMLAIRESMGLPLINVAASIDLPDLLWARGIEPRIGGKTYPQLIVSNVAGSESSRLRLEYHVAPGQVTATYNRRIPLPMREPGVELDGVSSLVLSILYANFWRNALGVNRPVLLQQEVSGFLDIAVGKRSQIPADELDGPTRWLHVEEEQAIHVPPDSTVSEFFESTDTSRVRAEDSNLRLEVCGLRPVGIEFGRSGTRTLLFGLVRRDGSLVSLLHSLSPDDRIFAFHCEPTTRSIVALSQLGTRQKPMLRVSTYDASGTLQSFGMYRLPRMLARDAFIVPGTWVPGSGGQVRFQMMERIRWVNEQHTEVEEQHVYRSLVLRTH